MYPKQTIGHITLGNKLRRAIWNVVRFGLFRPFGTKVFRPWRIVLLKLFKRKNANTYNNSAIGLLGSLLGFNTNSYGYRNC